MILTIVTWKIPTTSKKIWLSVIKVTLSIRGMPRIKYNQHIEKEIDPGKVIFRLLIHLDIKQISNSISQIYCTMMSFHEWKYVFLTNSILLNFRLDSDRTQDFYYFITKCKNSKKKFLHFTSYVSVFHLYNVMTVAQFHLNVLMIIGQ